MAKPFERGARLPPGTVLTMPDSMRRELASPLGPVVDETEVLPRIPRGSPVASVGDMTTATLLRLGVGLRFSVVDLKTRRAPGGDWEARTQARGVATVRVSSPQATITAELWNAVLEAWASPAPTRLLVEGEEDLAALPAILHAPEGAMVIYGIPDRGLALVQVAPGVRSIVSEALGRFEVKARGAAP